MYSNRTYLQLIALWLAAKLASTIDGPAWVTLRFTGHVVMLVIFAVMAHDVYREAKRWLSKHSLREAVGPVAMNVASYGGALWSFAVLPWWLAAVVTAVWMVGLIVVAGLVRGLLRVRRGGWPV